MRARPALLALVCVATLLGGCATLREARSSAGGWRAVFNFDGAHYRITDAPAATANKDSRPINWLRDFDTLDAIKPDKKAKDAQQLTVGTTKAPKGPFG